MTTPIASSSPAIDTSADREVTAGIKWLDQNQPGWWKEGRIDLGSLDLASKFACIICQLTSGYFYDGIRELGLDMKSTWAMGFYPPIRLKSTTQESVWLANAESLWRAEILRRRSPGADVGGMEGQAS